MTVSGNSDDSTTYFNGLGQQIGYLPYNPAIKNVDYQLLMGLGVVRAGIGLLGSTGTAALIQGPFGAISRSAVETAAAAGGSTVTLVTRLTSAPEPGRALWTAVGEGAEALTSAARSGGQLYTAQIPKALVSLLESAGLVQRSTTSMGGATGTELRFLPNATEFVAKFFKPVQ